MAYNPLSDPNSAYNNPKKGPHAGSPVGPIPLRGELTAEQSAWLHSGSVPDWRSMGHAQRRRMGAPSSHLEAAENS